MRLKDSDIKAIIKGLAEIVEIGSDFELYLFGSRTDDKKLGGDIDLLLVVSGETKDKLLPIRHNLISKSKKYISDQRVDITIRSKNEIKSDAFYKEIKNSLVRLR